MRRESHRNSRGCLLQERALLCKRRRAGQGRNRRGQRREMSWALAPDGTSSRRRTTICGTAQVRVHARTGRRRDRPQDYERKFHRKSEIGIAVPRNSRVLRIAFCKKGAFFAYGTYKLLQ